MSFPSTFLRPQEISLCMGHRLCSNITGEEISQKSLFAAKLPHDVASSEFRATSRELLWKNSLNLGSPGNAPGCSENLFDKPLAWRDLQQRGWPLARIDARQPAWFSSPTQSIPSRRHIDWRTGSSGTPSEKGPAYPCYRSRDSRASYGWLAVCGDFHLTRAGLFLTIITPNRVEELSF